MRYKLLSKYSLFYESKGKHTTFICTDIHSFIFFCYSFVLWVLYSLRVPTRISCESMICKGFFFFSCLWLSVFLLGQFVLFLLDVVHYVHPERREGSRGCVWRILGLRTKQARDADCSASRVVCMGGTRLLDNRLFTIDDVDPLETFGVGYHASL